MQIFKSAYRPTVSQAARQLIIKNCEKTMQSDDGDMQFDIERAMAVLWTAADDDKSLFKDYDCLMDLWNLKGVSFIEFNSDDSKEANDDDTEQVSHSEKAENKHEPVSDFGDDTPL